MNDHEFLRVYDFVDRLRRPFLGVSDVEDHPDRTLRVVVARNRVVEEHHDPVAREPLERASVFMNQCPDDLVVVAKHTHHFLGLTGFGERCEVPEIGEYDGYFAAMAPQQGFVANDQIGQLR